MTADRMAKEAAPQAKRNTADAEQLYRELKFIRRVEETIAVIYPSDKIKSPVHLSIGQESIAVGICSALRPDDIVAGTYRGHALFLAKGGDLNAMMAELYGKATGCSGGKGGSMHLVGFDQGILGTSAIVGSTIPIAVGYAMALKREGKGRVVTVFMGDGATEEGVFYESVNFAALHKLPIVFVCENNGYAIYTALNKRWSSSTICDRVKGFGVPVQRFETGDVFEIRDALHSHLDGIRQENAGPLFFECLTYRWLEHVGPHEDYNLGHRSRDEAKFWLENDQVALTGAMIAPARRATIDEEIETRIARAVEFAETSPLPTDDELYANVFAP
jgi:TPP-dependent pyruvate/acetoin dehydrogenase alpha subunit